MAREKFLTDQLPLPTDQSLNPLLPDRHPVGQSPVLNGQWGTAGKDYTYRANPIPRKAASIYLQYRWYHATVHWE